MALILVDYHNEAFIRFKRHVGLEIQFTLLYNDLKMSNMDQTNQKDTTIPKASLSPNFVSDSATFAYVHKKLEKLVSALYVITDFMDSDEPIRTKLRSSGTELIVYLSRTYSEGEREKKASLRYALNELSAIVSLCEIARKTGAVSEMNFSILKEEFLGLINLIESKFSGLTSSQSVQEMVFLELPSGNSNSQSIRYPEIPVISNISQARAIIKDTNVLKKKSAELPKVNVGDGSNRQEKIMSFMKRKGPSNIKDIAGVITGCSEKTVQRDLVSLISQGLVEKTGERRWSTYSVKN